MTINISYFIEDALKNYAPRKNLEGQIDTDVLVVGGGMTGLSVAYNLSKNINPRKIVLIEGNRIGFGTTGLSSGLLTDSVEEDYCDMEPEIHREVQSGVRGIVKVVKDETLECGLKEIPCLYFGTNNSQARTIEEEYLARKQGDFDVELLDKSQTLKNHGIDAEASMKNKEGHCIDPVKFCQELARRLENLGMRVYENTRLIEYNGKRKIAITPGGSVTYNDLVLANDSPRLEKGSLREKAFLLSSAVGVTEQLTSEQYQKLWKDGEIMGWDGEDFDYMYFRPVDRNRLLIGGADKLFSLRAARSCSYFNPDDLVKLKELLTRTFPNLRNVRFDNLWRGVIPGGIDASPFVGEIKKNHYVGLHSPGLPMAYRSGELIAQLVDRKTPEALEHYKHDRNLPLNVRVRALAKYQPFTSIANKIFFS